MSRLFEKRVRVMRVSGFLRRSSAWIPWMKVTDIRYEASVVGRVLGYATVYIESANEQASEPTTKMPIANR